MNALRLAVRTAASGWARRRQGDDVLPVRLEARRIYILPTRAGAGYAAMLVGMLLAGLNYGNSLALLLTFVLGALAAVTMFQCHRRLLHLEVREIAVLPAFAGEEIHVCVRVRLQSYDPRDLGVRCCAAREAPGPWTHFRAADPDAHADSAVEAVAVIAAPPAARGPWQVPRLRLEQRAPFGLFHAWVWLHPTVRGLVWPRPAGGRPLPRSSAGLRGTHTLRAGLDEWAGLRPFREGDSPRQVAWKAYARGAPLLVREYHDPEGWERQLDYAALVGLDVESRLSQLAQWIIEGEQAGEPWSLRLPSTTLPLSAGAAHRRASLDALALIGHEPDSA